MFQQIQITKRTWTKNIICSRNEEKIFSWQGKIEKINHCCDGLITVFLGSCISTFGPLSIVLFEEVIKPLGDGALLEKVCYLGSIWPLSPLTILSLSFLCVDQSVISLLFSSWPNFPCLHRLSLELCTRINKFLHWALSPLSLFWTQYFITAT